MLTLRLLEAWPDQESKNNLLFQGQQQYHCASYVSSLADINKSLHCLEKASLKDNMENLLMAAKEQALGTKAIEARVSYTGQDPRSRLCKEASETV